jgi:hypothetical protein
MGDRCDLIAQIARNFMGDAVDLDHAARRVSSGLANEDDVALTGTAASEVHAASVRFASSASCSPR